MSKIRDINKNLKKNSPIYVVDFLNIFSDFREIKYKLLNIDFHNIKYETIEQDTLEFFKLFFNKYIIYSGIKKNGNFLFILKKLYKYEMILYDIIEKYKHINIIFIIIESKYDSVILDKNKDDFLCQYILSYLILKNDNCILISNDKYRDREIYIKEFSMNSSTVIKVLRRVNDLIEKVNINIEIEQNICNKMLNQKCKRCTIPKNRLEKIL